MGDMEEGRSPSAMKSTHLDTTPLFTGKDPTEELTAYYESFLNAKEQDIEAFTGKTLGQLGTS